ncbi:hypothetical protein BBJ29_008010 [Phytophthora kernoviae]|uniref:FAD-binding FR-type domain-containing protein n=1 Tax=Phytophthora kernoviae TaxID=325452 RepID=A0A3F2RE50_9STRA|nr:hypothetical protein BBJ29_008010 [Phytophthora kernoviae]RLN54535.1 hypothetical protein BBP00_00008902 [Phytophthora kernoviae]
MAPNNANELTTPQPDGAFTTLKTPDIDDKRNNLVSQPHPSSSASAQRLPLLGNVLQFLIFAAMFVYAYGQLFYFTKAYSDLSATIGTWYGVPKDAGKDSNVGHDEMIRPTYFFLLGFIPLAASLLLFQALRHFNVRRISSYYVLGFARVLRRKPRVFGWVARVSLGELLFLAFLVGGNVYVFHFYYVQRVEKMRKRGSEFNFSLYLKMIALTLGFTCVYNMAFLFLPATRNCVWMEFLNISYANVGGKEGHDPWMNFFGEIALLSFLAIGFTSIPWMRRKMYNTFYSVHHLFIIGTIFAVLHWNNIIVWIFPSVLLYTVSRAVSSSNGFTPVTVREFTTLSHDVVKVVLSRSTTRSGDFKVGQFIYLNVPAISKLQWHAFTIGSSPRTSPDTLTILLKSLGDWTDELVKYSEDCKRNNVLPTVYMDGYYGASLEMYDEYSTVCLVGGGIGVTPLFAILEDIVAKLQQGGSLRQKVFFIFTFRELSLLEEIHPLLMQIKELDPQEQYFSLHFSLTRAPTSDQLDQRIDHERLAGQTHVLATRYDTTTTRKTPQPFAEPLHSRSSKAAMYTVSFFVTLLIVILVKYGNKVEENDENLWPLQNFVEITLLIVVAILSAYACIVMERKAPQLSINYSRAFDVSETPRMGLPSLAADVQTFRDLVAEYNVEVGRRPNIPKLMKKVLAGHQQFRGNHPGAIVPGNSTIGVFVSGPEALKMDIEYAIADIGTKHFDIFEEEFEL